MKLSLDRFEGAFSQEIYQDRKIFRHIFRLHNDFMPERCLIRIYAFRTKTIVIASQLIGRILWDDFIISRAACMFRLNRRNLTWINHTKFLINLRPAKEEFHQSIFSWHREYTFPWSADRCELEREQEISRQTVEEMIETKLEPVETWLGLDPTIRQRREAKKQEETQKILHLYLQRYLEFFASQIWLRQILAQPQVGAVFFYPEVQLKVTHRRLEFLTYKYLDESLNVSERVALPYVQRYNPREEMVVCVSLASGHVFCEILSKSFLKRH